MNNAEITTLLTRVTDLVRSLRPLVDDRAERTVTVKSDSNFVTTADLNVQNALEAGLRTIAPTFAFLGEESDDHAIDPATPTWVIDPIDGTTNFIHRAAYSAISVGLVQNGQPILGVVFNPYLDELFAAAAGQGATCNGQPILVTDLDSFDTALVGIGTMPYFKQYASDVFRLFKNLFLAGADIRRSGTAALDLCSLAMGRLDVFAEPMLYPWDYAAGSLIIREAGGRLTDWAGNDLAVDGHCHSMAGSNTRLHSALLAIIADADVMHATNIGE